MCDCRNCEAIIDYTEPDNYGFHFRCNRFNGEDGFCSLKIDVPCPDFKEVNKNAGIVS